MNNKVLLIQTPQFMPDAFNRKVAQQRGCYAYPPAGLQCIANALSDRDLEIDILDLNYHVLKSVVNEENFDDIKGTGILDEYLNRHNPSIIGVTCLTIYGDIFEDTHPLTCLLKHLRKRDKSIIIAGGPIATNEYENYLKKDLCHFVIEGEGENKIKFLFDYLFEGGSDYNSLRGIYFKDKGNIKETSGRKDNVALKGNLINTYKKLPIEDYSSVGSLNPFSRMAGLDKRFAGIQLNRGCRANCKFCGVAEFMGKGLRQYPVHDLLEEIHYLVKERGVRHFEILDDDFLGYGEFLKALITLLKDMKELNKKYGISWSAGNGLIAASLTEDLLGLMRDSGCIGFRIGIESGNGNMLKKMRKPVTLSVLRKTGKKLRKFPEIFVAGNYIMGLLGEETFGEMLDTFKFSAEMNLDWTAFTTFQFTSKATMAAEHLKPVDNSATDFIPAKDTAGREILETEGIVSGPAIFNMPKSSVPSHEQIKQIWFTFNLVANYINNKNLKPGGMPEKFISWVEAVRVVYPENPYMPLFTGIGCVLLGRQELANKYLEKTKENLRVSEYWRKRFSQFGLTDLINRFPQNDEKAQEVLEPLRQRYAQWF
ncbi:B12-binding domain-containing radical SAM protein [bacterium]|nr:B12-binding domain-containing radical SAM protein [bacterium]